MRTMIWGLLVALGGVLVMAGVGEGQGTVVCDQMLDHVYGGERGRCMPREVACASVERVGVCEPVGGGYCADAFERTTCNQGYAECQAIPGDPITCATITVPCEDTYTKLVCVPLSAVDCGLEAMAYYSCATHPSGDTTKNGCVEFDD